MTDYGFIRETLRDGDLVLYAPKSGALSRLYQYTHAELVKWNRDAKGFKQSLMTVGFREFEGCRAVTLSSQVRKYPGCISIFRPVCDNNTAWWAAELLMRQTGKKYSWWTIWIAFLWHLTLVRFLARWRPGPDDDATEPTKWNAAKVCSTSVVWVFRRWMGKKRQSEWPCRHLPMWRVKPQDLADDLASFTLLYPGLMHGRAG